MMSARNIVVDGTGAVTRDEIIAAARCRRARRCCRSTPTEWPIGWRPFGGSPARGCSANTRRRCASPSSNECRSRSRTFPTGHTSSTATGSISRPAPPPPALPYLDVDNPGPSDPPTKAALQVLTALRPEVFGQVGRIAAPVGRVDHADLDRWPGGGLGDRRPHRGEGRQARRALLTQPGTHLRRVEPGSADRQVTPPQTRGNYRMSHSARLRGYPVAAALPFWLRGTT